MKYTNTDKNPVGFPESAIHSILCARNIHHAVYQYNMNGGHILVHTQYLKDLNSIPPLLPDYLPGKLMNDSITHRYLEIDPIYKNYESIHSLINKRTTFIHNMRRVHSMNPADLKLSQYKPSEEIRQLINRIGDKIPTNIDREKVLTIIRLYNSTLESIAHRLEKNDIAKHVCFNSLIFNDIYFDGSKSVKVSTHDLLGINDYIWDYACLLARSNDATTYLGLLHNNQIVPELTEWYSDPHAATRLVVSIALVDTLDILTSIAMSTSTTLQNVNYINTRIDRLIRFVTQSYTTLDYFRYKYEVTRG